MALFKTLPNTYILSPLSCFSKKRLFEEICELASMICGIDEIDLLQYLHHRESLGATVCADGVGLPHAAVPSLEQSFAILAILPQEIPYQSVDADPSGVDMALAFFISPNEDYNYIENLLISVSKELGNSELVNSFRRIWQDEHKLFMVLHKLDALLTEDLKSINNKPKSEPKPEPKVESFLSLLNT